MRPISCLIALAILLPAMAQAEPEKAPQRYLTTTVFGSDACPAPKGDEIIVCARLPESDRYRIPPNLRKKPRKDSGAGASWASRARGLEDAQRFTRPGSCTAIGAGGQSGCTDAMIRQWNEERRDPRLRGE